MFFSSSRRRHTSWPRDWSSDVCSSDLLRRMDKSEHECGKNNCLNRNGKAPEIFISAVHRSDIETGQPYRSAKRSEERRVGKECRSEWARDEIRKNDREQQNREDMSRTK